MKVSHHLIVILIISLFSCKKQKVEEVLPHKDDTTVETFVPKKQDFKVVGYIWSRASIIDDLSKVDFEKITHLNIAFINPDPTSATFSDMPALNTVVKTAHQKGVYVMLSCGGGSPQRYYTELLRNKRAALVKNFIDFVDKYNLDGIDVDLEGDDIDANYEAFITELRTPLTERKKLLTSAVAWWTRARVTDKALQAFDFINIMAYDATGRWDLTNPGQHSTYAYAVQHLNYWHLQRSLNKKKLILGLPFYGYGFGTVFNSNASLAQMSWQTVQQNYPDWVNADEIPFPNNGGTFYYNGKNTIKAKTELAVKDGGGVMIWQLLYDSQNDNSLLKLIDKTHKETTN
nr:glycosyl hydrolase family 18 protein [Pedobacter sp. ASV28]